MRLPHFNGSHEKFPSWKRSFQAIISLDDRLASDILEPDKRGKDFIPDDVEKEQRAQERLRSLLVLSCNAHESDASNLVNNAPVGCVEDGVFEGTAAWSALLAHYESKSAARTVRMIKDVLQPRQDNETVAMFAGRLERLARQLNSRRKIPLICDELLGIFLLQGVGKDYAIPRGIAISAAGQRPMTFNEIRDVMMEHAQEQDDAPKDDIPHAYSAASGNSKKDGGGKTPSSYMTASRPHSRCHCCGSTDHMARECRASGADCAAWRERVLGRQGPPASAIPSIIEQFPIKKTPAFSF